MLRLKPRRTTATDIVNIAENISRSILSLPQDASSVFGELIYYMPRPQFVARCIGYAIPTFYKYYELTLSSSSTSWLFILQGCSRYPTSERCQLQRLGRATLSSSLFRRTDQPDRFVSGYDFPPPIYKRQVNS